MADQEPTAGAGLRAPRAAGVAGIVISLLLGLALVLIQRLGTFEPGQSGRVADRRGAPHRHRRRAEPGADRRHHVPGIHRGRTGPDRATGGPVLRHLVPGQRPAVRGHAVRRRPRRRPGHGRGVGVVGGSRPDILCIGRQVTGLLLRVYAARMAAVFTGRPDRRAYQRGRASGPGRRGHLHPAAVHRLPTADLGLGDAGLDAAPKVRVTTGNMLRQPSRCQRARSIGARSTDFSRCAGSAGRRGRSPSSGSPENRSA